MSGFLGGIFNWGGQAAAAPPVNPLGGDKPPEIGDGGHGGIGGGVNVIEPAPLPDPLADPHAAEIAAKAALKKDGDLDPLGGPDLPPPLPPPADQEEWYVSAWNSVTTFLSSAWNSVYTTVTSWFASICDCFKGSS